jgi:hypothetical protein
VNLAAEDSVGYWACKPRGNLAGGRKMLVRFSKFYDKLAEVHRIYGDVRSSRIRSKGHLRRGDPSYLRSIF